MARCNKTRAIGLHNVMHRGVDDILNQDALQRMQCHVRQAVFAIQEVILYRAKRMHCMRHEETTNGSTFYEDTATYRLLTTTF